MSEKGVRVEYEVHFKRDRRARRVVRQGPPPSPAPDAVPRIVRLLALAWKWEGMVRRGEVKDYAEIARLMGLSRARVTQIEALTLLSPTIQQELLGDNGHSVPSGRLLVIAMAPCWTHQYHCWWEHLGRTPSVPPTQDSPSPGGPH